MFVVTLPLYTGTGKNISFHVIFLHVESFVRKKERWIISWLYNDGALYYVRRCYNV